MTEEIVFTSETCSSTSLRRWRTLDMKWMAEWQEEEEEEEAAGGSALSGGGWAFVSACDRSTCLSFTVENGCWGWSWGSGRVFGGRRTNCSAAFLTLISNWKGSNTQQGAREQGCVWFLIRQTNREEPEFSCSGCRSFKKNNRMVLYVSVH